ncbi:MAE_28990/MAE_18760 family HEPN-like nuclease [Anaerolineales bacterium HSG25]|nr:MAE_28990/MAE_18760 family HEPN-like nuclease [Anaerolineales bacterium HSG25]
MLSDISANSTIRLREVHSLLQVIRSLESETPLISSKDTKITKGLFFVHLYGAYEYTVTETIQKVLQIISDGSYSVSSYKPSLLSVVLDAECKAICSVGPDKKWLKRRALFEKAATDGIVSIDTVILPTGTGNLKQRQLEELWSMLGVESPALPRPPLIGRLEELVENRNAISHGRESPVTIGGRFTSSDLESRYNDVNELCSYLIQQLEIYLRDKQFLR